MELMAMTGGETNIFFFPPLVLFLIPLLISLFLKHMIFSRDPPIPPGPFAWPLIGNILQMAGKQLHTTLATLAKVHGPLMSLRFGTRIVVVASSPAAAREVLKTHDRILSGRTVTLATPLINPKLNHFSIGFSNECNDHWKGLRAICKANLFTAKVLNSQVDLREKKVMELVDFLGSKEGQVVNLAEVVYTTVTNMLSNSIFSIDFLDFDGKGVGEGLRELITKEGKLGVSPDLSYLYPILSGLDIQGVQEKRKKLLGEFCTIWEDIIQERRKQGSDVSGQRDFLDVLINSQFTDDQINQLVVELLIAGTDTSSMATEWAMADLMKNQHSMHKLREELEHKIGTEDEINESHLAQLSYLQACVKETLRLHPPGPLLLPHRAIETCQVMGFTIPKDSQIFVNMWAIGRDPTIWNDPLSFKPERFLDSSLDFMGNDFEYVPFGSGRRICPGQPLAIKQVPFIVASLIHVFDWFLPGNMNATELDMDENVIITLRKNQPLQLIPKIRN